MESHNIYFTGKNQVEIRREPVSDPEPGQIVVQTTKTLISTGTEGICLGRLFDPDTHWDRWVKYPFSPGYSLAGRVVAVGNGVTELREGHRVALRCPHRQFVTSAAPPEGRVARIPDGVPDEDATWFGLANIVQTGVRAGGHALGESVVVVGLGILGQLVVQYARLLGARDVIAIDVSEPRLQMARAHGATTALRLGVEEAREEVMRITGGHGAEVVYDVTGNAAVLEKALPLVRRFGRLILLGDTGSPGSQRLTPDVVTRGIRIIGAHDGNPPPESTDWAPWDHPRMTDLFFAYLERGDMRVSDLVTHRYSPADAPEAYRMLREERASAMGVIFDWSQV